MITEIRKESGDHDMGEGLDRRNSSTQMMFLLLESNPNAQVLRGDPHTSTLLN